MSDTPHTPSPYSRYVVEAAPAGRAFSIRGLAPHYTGRGDLVAREIETRETADYLARAANAHDDLVKALRAQEKAEEALRTPGVAYPEWQALEDKAADLRTAALAKVAADA